MVVMVVVVGQMDFIGEQPAILVIPVEGFGTWLAVWLYYHLGQSPKQRSVR